MILYKFRSLSNFEHVADIIQNERLYCPTYEELNDPFEGIFLHLWTVSFRNKSQKKFAFPIKLEETLTKTRVCSLSSSINDVRLWSYYADVHKEIVFGIDFTGIESHVHDVEKVDFH